MTDISRFGKVAVMLGGDSNERAVSLKSGEAVLNSLIFSGVDAHAFDPAERQLSELQSDGFDRVFIALHGKIGEDGVLQATLSMMDIPFTGSNMLASAIGMDKVRSKLIWQALGLRVIPGQVIEREQIVNEDLISSIVAQLGSKLMVKPACEGSSLGMTHCESESNLAAAIVTARNYSDQVIVEKWMSGSEYTVAIIDKQTLPSIRIQPSHDFYDYTAKYDLDSGTQYFCPSGLTEADELAVRELAMKAFLALGCSGWGRVDFMADAVTNEMHLMELNTIPGMTETSLVPKAAKVEGIDFDELCLRILDSSVANANGGAHG